MADKPVKEEMVRVPMSEIHVDHTWNGRNPSYLQEPSVAPAGEDFEGPSGELGMAGLVASIKAHGQDDPVDVRPYAGKGRFQFSLVTGFRRYEALRRISEEGVNAPNFDSAKPTILIHVRALSEVEARDLNGRENLDRQNLNVADIAFHCARLRGDSAKSGLNGGKGMTDTQIAESIGRSQGYTSKLLRITDKLASEITKAWRESPVDPLTVDQFLALAEFPKATQKEKFDEMVAARGGGKSKQDWTVKAKDQCAELGMLIGVMQRYGVIAEQGAMSVARAQKVIACAAEAKAVKLKKDGAPTENQWEALTKAFTKGFEAGLTPPAPKEEKKSKEGNSVQASA